MSFFDTHLSGCSPRNLCLKCKLLADLRPRFSTMDLGNFIVTLDKVIDAHLNEGGAQLETNTKEPETFEVSPQDDLLDTEIQSLHLSVRVQNALVSNNITTLRSLITRSRTDILRMDNLGKLSLKEIQQMLASKGLSLWDGRGQRPVEF